MLSKDFKEFAELLHSNGVEYLIVGGYALAAYGHPRYTGDLDFWIGCDGDNAARVLKALEQFGFGALGVTQEFDECYARKVDVEIDGLRLHFISLDDFKRNKRAVGRHQDLADLEGLGEGGESDS